jgi:hypothetical protein
MKNIQVIDGAENCAYDIFAAEDDEFQIIFPSDGQDVEFVEDAYARLGEKAAARIFGALWDRRVDKKTVKGLHGTLFCGLLHKRRYYPTKREAEAIANPQ